MRLKDLGLFYSLEGTAKCETCNGTGLYQGFAEQDGAFVICYKCDGTGEIKISLRFKKFKGRENQPKCKRVYTRTMGYGITDKNITVKGRLFPFADYGCTYKEWLKGAKPIPLKFLGCPYQETNQRLQSKDVNDLYKTRCKENSGWGMIANCKLYNDKHKCWEIFERRLKNAK